MEKCKLKKGDRIYECRYHEATLIELILKRSPEQLSQERSLSLVSRKRHQITDPSCSARICTNLDMMKQSLYCHHLTQAKKRRL